MGADWCLQSDVLPLDLPLDLGFVRVFKVRGPWRAVPALHCRACGPVSTNPLPPPRPLPLPSPPTPHPLPRRDTLTPRENPGPCAQIDRRVPMIEGGNRDLCEGAATRTHTHIHTRTHAHTTPSPHPHPTPRCLHRCHHPHTGTHPTEPLRLVHTHQHPPTPAHPPVGTPATASW